MSFRCEICKEPQPVGHAPERIVTKTRKKDAPETSKPCTEIAEEKNCCPPCAEKALEAIKEYEEAVAAQEAKARELMAKYPDAPHAEPERPSDWRDRVSA